MGLVEVDSERGIVVRHPGWPGVLRGARQGRVLQLGCRLPAGKLSKCLHPLSLRLTAAPPPFSPSLLPLQCSRSWKRRTHSCWMARSSTSRTKLGSHREALHDRQLSGNVPPRQPGRRGRAAHAWLRHVQCFRAVPTQAALSHPDPNYRPATRAASELTSFALHFPGGAATARRRKGASPRPRRLQLLPHLLYCPNHPPKL